MVPTSANPLHCGHLAIMQYAEEYVKKRFLTAHFNSIFELTTLNCDKGKLNWEEVENRIKQFDQICRPVLITSYPTFVQKSVAFPNTLFCVGIDTIERIDNIKYVYGSEKERDRCYKIIEENNCSFLVFERNGKTYNDIHKVLSIKLRLLCEQAFGYKPVDISSTQLREKL